MSGSARDPDPRDSQPVEWERPNIVLIIGDDHGYPDFGFMGSKVAKTPNLDRLATRGIVFRFGYSTASHCRPALLSLLTGLHPAQYYARVQHAQEEWTRRGAELGTSIEAFRTLPRVLAGYGYASFQAGKYWEGSFDKGGFTQGMGDPFGSELVRQTILPVTQFIDRHPEQPFFLWFAPKLPHVPHDPPGRFLDAYKDAGLSEGERRYLASVSWFDTAVGALIGHVRKRGLRRRTLVVYVVDNGWDARTPHPREPQPHGKLSLYELGFRTPVVLNWPGRIPAGATRDELVSLVDLFPTLLDYANVPQLGDRPGRSLRPIVEGRPGSAREYVIGHVQRAPSDPAGGSFLRSRRWYFIDFEESNDELYDMDVDPQQEHDVADRHVAVVEQLRERIRAWRAEMETLPSNWQPLSPATAASHPAR